MDHTYFPVGCNFFGIGYCGHPNFPYAHIQIEQANNLILSHFQEEDHSFVHDTLKNKKAQLVSLYFVYRPKKNASRTDITNDDQNAYIFVPTYRDEYTSLYKSYDISCCFFLLKYI